MNGEHKRQGPSDLTHRAGNALFEVRGFAGGVRDPHTPKRDHMLFCSAGPRGLCGDPRIFDDLKKVPQVFRHPGGSLALQTKELPLPRAVAQRFSRLRQQIVFRQLDELNPLLPGNRGEPFQKLLKCAVTFEMVDQSLDRDTRPL